MRPFLSIFGKMLFNGTKVALSHPAGVIDSLQSFIDSLQEREKLGENLLPDGSRRHAVYILVGL